MESVGQKLRQARLRLVLSLEEVSAKTRIPVKSLQAIETDEPLRIGSAFLYKSFVRQFAEQLQVEYGGLESAVQSTANVIPEPLMPGQRQDSAPKVPPLGTPRSKEMRWLKSVASLFIMLVLCSGLYGTWESSRSNLQASAASFVKALTQAVREEHPVEREIPTRSGPVAATTRSTAKSVQTASASAEEPRMNVAEPPLNDVAEPPVAQTPATESEAFHIELSALERTWLSIMADGKLTFSGILEPSETKVLEGHDSARVRTGNAGGVNVVFNGKALGTLGERGQVRTVLFTRNTYEVIEPPAHIALTGFSMNAE